MKLITRNTDYALRAVCCIAGNKGKLTTANELVAKLGIPRPFLRKILRILNAEGILISHKGIGGGFELAKKAWDIHMLDIVRIFQGPLKLNECLLKKSICPNIKTCPIRKKIISIEKHAALVLEDVTIFGLLR